MTTTEKPADIVAALVERLGTDRSRDRIDVSYVGHETLRAALEEINALRRRVEQAEARTSKAERRATTVDSANGALQNDRDRARGWAAELAESALRVAAERGIDAEDVRKQIAFDRHQRWLQLRQEVWHESGFEAVMSVLHGPSRHEKTVLRRTLTDALDAGKRHAEVDRRCGKSYDTKAVLPDLSIPAKVDESDPDRPEQQGRFALSLLTRETREHLARRTYDDDPLVVLGAAIAATAPSGGYGMSRSERMRERIALQVGTLCRIRDEFARARRAGWIPEPRPSENPYALPHADIFAELVSALVHCETASEIEALRGGRDWTAEHEAVAALRLTEIEEGTSA